MSDDRIPSAEAWARINALFHRALDEPAGQRRAFVETACGGDLDLRREVLSLLAAHDRAEGFIESPALPDLGPPIDAAGAATADADVAGRRIGPYVLRRVLGEGGMGVVYLATDTRLGRDVALKALPVPLTRDPVRRERLRREARAAASLTHPGIATVYALEEIDDHLYIANEFVPGETLRDELARGPLSFDGAVATARAIADAVGAAHDRGIVHRDLKPENIVRTATGSIKVLDFGLARLTSDASPDRALTADGDLLGTPAYMAPEQIRGEPVDPRTDLFALGIVMFELVTGTHPFRRGDSAATIARILESDPGSLGGRSAGASDPRLARLDGIVQRCLAKRAEDRYRSAHALLEALDAVAMNGWVAPGAAGEAGTPASETTKRALWWWQFHQGVTSAAYAALVVPLWFAHVWWPGRPGAVLFLAGLTSAIVAMTLRLHLWFTVHSLRSQWDGQQRRSGWWLKLADSAFVLVLVGGGLVCLDRHLEVAVLLIASAAAALISFVIIEPATARAAKLMGS